MSRLVVYPNTPKAWEIRLKPGTNLLGRGFATDFKIEDPSVSSTHCQIVLGNGTATIKDLGSTNGTFLNQAQIQEAKLEPGHSLRLGGVEMIFYADDRQAAQPALVAQLAAPLPVARLAGAAHAVSAPAAQVVHAVPAPSAQVVHAVPAPSAQVVHKVPTPVAHAVAAPAAPAIPIPVPVSGVPVATAAPAAPPPPTGTRLSIAGRPASPRTAHAVVPAPVESEEAGAAPPVAPPVTGVHGPRFCKFHPKSYARWVCHKCNRTFCDLCVVSRSAGGTVKKSCRSCGVEVVPLQVTVERAVATSFFASLPGALIYPFRGFGSVILIIAGIGFGGVEYIGHIMTGPLIWLIQVAAYGFLFLFMQNIIHTTAADEKEPLGFPDADGIFGAAFQLAATIFLCFGLPIALVIARFFEVEIPVSAIIATALLGCVYFPMAFLAVAMKDTVVAMNPLIVIPAMLKAPFQYLITTIVLMVVLGSRLLGATVLSFAVSGSTTTHDMSVLFLGMAGGALWAFVSIYLMSISMRILGLFYNANKEKLDWF